MISSSNSGFIKAGLFILAVFGYGAAANSSADSLPVCDSLAPAATFSENIITIVWRPLSGASAYNFYADWGKGYVRANFSPITSGTRFSLWRLPDANGSDGRETLKGKNIRMFLCPASKTGNNGNPVYKEIARSKGLQTCYYCGFEKTLTKEHCRRTLNIRNHRSELPGQGLKTVTRAVFLDKYPLLARTVADYYARKIDPHDDGACVPFSTLVAKYFTGKGLPCYRTQGVFISQFHNFNVIVIDSLEYVLDFTSDQFIPGSAPVFIPRSMCHVDSIGSLTGRPEGTFTTIYQFDRLFDPSQISFTQTPYAQDYQDVLDSLLSIQQ